MSIQLKRIYDSVSDDDGRRVLVDGMWPRGVKKADAALDDWYKSVAPSSELRRWFGHDRDRWEKFRESYRAELDDADNEALDALREIVAQEDEVTLLFAARDTECNHAVVLKDWLEDAA
ncbi:DUF488 family protein [Salinisphaera sp.]|uniref:DUF488 domain-containing protein n=1 Tax=Salinisphaera sp. TaxID=1914330 RepID=UPI000C3A16C1|nr:DUF488 family protein [Salinisphaera sp.]MBS61578.1 hypothetical protein [Salinisphaera sp.]